MLSISNDGKIHCCNRSLSVGDAIVCEECKTIYERSEVIDFIKRASDGLGDTLKAFRDLGERHEH